VLIRSQIVVEPEQRRGYNGILPMQLRPYENQRGPQRLPDLWTVSRGIQSIRCALSTHPSGWELKLTAADTAFRTCLCQTMEDVRDTARKWHAEATSKGWK
jgi:hypothetical protein